MFLRIQDPHFFPDLLVVQVMKEPITLVYVLLTELPTLRTLVQDITPSIAGVTVGTPGSYGVAGELFRMYKNMSQIKNRFEINGLFYMILDSFSN